MWLSVAALVVAFAALAAIALRLLARSERTRLLTTRLQIAVPDLHPDLHGLRIALLTDLHVGLMYVPRERLLRALDAADPDLLLLGGDYAGSRFRVPQATELVEELAGRWTTAAVPGNTEHYFPWDLEDLGRRLAERGGRLLRNQAWRLRQGSATIEVLGLDDPTYHAADVSAALARSEPTAQLRVAVAHSPGIWQDIPRLGAHIALCGHTHGGQLRVPGTEALVTHPTYPRRLASGLFAISNGDRPHPRRLAGHWDILRATGPIRVSTRAGALLYVSRGVGLTAPRVRLFSPPEVVSIEFVPDSPQLPEAKSTGGPQQV